MLPITALIVEDEPLDITSLELLIQEHCTDIELIGKAQTVSEAVNAINELQPQLIFLDIALGNRNGFELFEIFPNPSFHVIMTTAYNDYAIRALRASAADYLLKPIDDLDLQRAVERVKQRMNGQRLSYPELLHENMHKIQSLVIPDGQNNHVVRLKDICYLKGDGAYTHFFFQRGKKIMAAKNLGHFADILPLNGFFRVHNSFIVNREFITGTRGKAPMDVLLSCGAEIRVSGGKKPDFLKWL